MHLSPSSKLGYLSFKPDACRCERAYLRMKTHRSVRLTFWARLLKGLIAYQVDNYNFINMISQKFIDYIFNIVHFVRPSTLLNYKYIRNIPHLFKRFVKIQIVIVALSTG